MKVIDAKNRTLGRVATEAARALMGKDVPSYTPHIPGNAKVQIINAGKIKISHKKLRDTTHTRYSGYPGGIKSETLEETIAKKGYAEIFRKAVSGMIPRNTLKKDRLKNLEVVE